MDKIAIITGSGRGIGLSIAIHLQQAGYTVIGCGRSSRDTHFPAGANWLVADVSIKADAESVVQFALDKFGRIDLLVNNAGVQVEKTLVDSTDEDWDRVMGVNCRGVFNMCRACLPGMINSAGNIINIGSISGNVADPSMALYNASKSFVHGLTRSIAVDHGPNVRCNAIQPGWIMTSMADDAFALAREPVHAKKDALTRHPIGRFGQPEDIAQLVLFLASENSHYLTGECITIDGGMTAASPLRPELF